MSVAPFYPVTSAHPPFRVFVRVLWRGRLFRAQRDSHPVKKHLCWITYDKEFSRVYLPPQGKRGKAAWGENPEAWQPLDPSKWGMPLPAVERTWTPHDGVERMVNIRARHRAFEIPGGQSVAEKAPWWWDATAIVYQAKGEITPDMAVGRMMRAAAVSGAAGIVGQPKKQKDTAFESDAEYTEWAKKEAEREQERAKQSSARREKFEPLPADLKDWDTAMGWFAALNPPELRAKSSEPFSLNLEQQIIVWRASRYSWSEIARYLKRSIRTARGLYRDGMEAVHRAANGQPARPWRTAVDHIGQLRESNRAHHNRSNVYG